MAIVVEGELRSPRRDLFCVYVGIQFSCALLIALVFFVDPFYLMLRAHNGCPTPVATNFFFFKKKKRQSISQLPIAVWSHLSVVRTHRTLAPHFSTTPATSSIRHLSGVMMASKSVRMLLFFSSSSVSASYPHHTSEFLAMDTSITRFSFDQFTCTLSKRLRLLHHIHQLFLRSVDVVSSGRHQIAASAAVGTRLYGSMTRHQLLRGEAVDFRTA